MRASAACSLVAFHLAAGTGCLGHGLILQGVHAAKPAHGLLVEFYRGLTGLAHLVLGVEFGQPCRDHLAEFLQAFVIHSGECSHHAFAFYAPCLNGIVRHAHEEQ